MNLLAILCAFINLAVTLGTSQKLALRIPLWGSDEYKNQEHEAAEPLSAGSRVQSENENQLWRRKLYNRPADNTFLRYTSDESLESDTPIKLYQLVSRDFDPKTNKYDATVKDEYNDNRYRNNAIIDVINHLNKMAQENDFVLKSHDLIDHNENNDILIHPIGGLETENDFYTQKKDIIWSSHDMSKHNRTNKNKIAQDNDIIWGNHNLVGINIDHKGNNGVHNSYDIETEEDFNENKNNVLTSYIIRKHGCGSYGEEQNRCSKFKSNKPQSPALKCFHACLMAFAHLCECFSCSKKTVKPMKYECCKACELYFGR